MTENLTGNSFENVSLNYFSEYFSLEFLLEFNFAGPVGTLQRRQWYRIKKQLVASRINNFFG